LAAIRLASTANPSPLTARQFDAKASAVGNIFDTEPARPAFVIDRLLPQAHGVENAIGGAGKTTRHIYEAAHIILGRDLYGRRIVQPGPVVIFTKEEDGALFRHRVFHVIKALPDLSAADRKRLAENLHLEVLTGTDERLARLDGAGNLMQTDLGARIVKAYQHEGLALVEFDSLNMFSPGETHGNYGAAAALTAMAHISPLAR
jgi:RecA-family ATPase